MLRPACCAWLLFLAGTASAQITVVCVPGSGQDYQVPHRVAGGKSTMLKGTVRGVPAGNTFDWEWDPGDGSAPVTGSSTKPYVIETAHTYSGSEGDTFTAILEVTYLADTDTDEYLVEIVDDSALAAKVSIAIDEGLWCLQRSQVVTSPTLGYWTNVGGAAYYPVGTASCVEAFENQGHLPDGDATEDPYVDTARRGLNYMFQYLQTVAIGPQTAGDPDTNGNGIGLRLNASSGREMYETGIAMMALAASRAPGLVAEEGAANVLGRTYADILQDMVDFAAWAQNEDGADPPVYRGAWRYGANSASSDNDVSRWVVMGLEAAERLFPGVVTVPAFVRTELALWVPSIQLGDGSSPYTRGVSMFNNLTKTTGLVTEFNVLGYGLGSGEVQNALDYIEAFWGNPNAPSTNDSGNFCAMRGMREAMLLFGLRALPGGGLEWYHDSAVGLAPALVASQAADGSFNTHGVWGPTAHPMGTGIALSILQEAILSLSRDTVEFTAVEGGADPAQETVAVTDINDTFNLFGLDWTAAEAPDESWLTLTNDSGIHGDEMTLSASVAGLSPGAHTATVEVHAENAGNSPRRIYVTFTVDPGSGTPVDPATKSFVGKGCSAGAGRPAGGAATWLCLLLTAVCLIRGPRRAAALEI